MKKISLLLLSILFLAACKEEEPDITGTWVNAFPDGKEIVFNFREVHSSDYPDITFYNYTFMVSKTFHFSNEPQIRICPSHLGTYNYSKRTIEINPVYTSGWFVSTNEDKSKIDELATAFFLENNIETNENNPILPAGYKINVIKASADSLILEDPKYGILKMKRNDSYAFPSSR